MSDIDGNSLSPENVPITTETKKRKTWGTGCIILLFLSLFGILGLTVFVLLFFIGFLSEKSGVFTEKFSSFSRLHDGLTEKFVEGNTFSSNKIALIEIRGVIIDGDGGSMWKAANSSLIIRQLMRAQEDPNVKGVLLFLDTPGGEVTASDNIYDQILETKKSGKVVVSYMNSIAASGGYYVAMASDFIIAHRLCITGSIGVIMQAYNYHGLLNKIGVFTETYKSGKMKDMLDGSRPRTEEEKIITQDIVNQIYKEFVMIVDNGRNSLTEDQIVNTEIGDGRIFLGSKALELGMVDAIGFYDDALNKTLELANIPISDYKIITYQKTFSFSEIFANMGSPENNISLDLLKTKSLDSLIEPGKAYFLPLNE